MATTRNLKQIDEALRRPGRMDRIFHLQRPTQTERETILYSAAKETMDDQLIDYVDWKKVYLKFPLSFNFFLIETHFLTPTDIKRSTLGIIRYPVKQKVRYNKEQEKYLML
jgi:SpoVK/Ycf46/Vps4 family AAA+-type ATPase